MMRIFDTRHRSDSVPSCVEQAGNTGNSRSVPEPGDNNNNNDKLEVTGDSRPASRRQSCDPQLFSRRLFGDDNGDVHHLQDSSTSSVVALTPVRDVSDDDPSTRSTAVTELGDNDDGSTRTYVPEETRLEDGLAQRGRLYGDRISRRLVLRDGTCNVSSKNITRRRLRYLADIFTTLIDLRWRYSALLFASAFIVSWIFFGALWFALAYAHGDLSDHDDDNWEACVAHVFDFPTAILFSMETQTTIGYGYRVTTPHCAWAFVLVMIQACVGTFIQCLMTGLIFAKLSRPKRRAQTIMFSRRAVVCKRDYEYHLLFRVGDMRRSHFIGASVRAVLVKDRLTKEGETIPLCQYPLDLQTETGVGENFVFLVWPATVVHRITSASPLWDVSAEELITERFEIIVILEGIVESTGMTTQMRTSYLPSDILWGHRLAPLLTYQKDNGRYQIDFARFHAVVPTTMPDCSARRLAEVRTLTGADDDDDGEGGDGDDVFHFATSTAKKSSRTADSRGFARRFRLRRQRSQTQSSTDDYAASPRDTM